MRKDAGPTSVQDLGDVQRCHVSSGLGNLFGHCSDIPPPPLASPGALIKGIQRKMQLSPSLCPYRPLD